MKPRRTSVFFSRPFGTDEGEAGSQPTTEAVGYSQPVPAGTGDSPPNQARFFRPGWRFIRFGQDALAKTALSGVAQFRL